MSQIDNWPQAPILASLPAVAKLAGRYNPDLLIEDLENLDGAEWNQPRIVSGDGLGDYVTDLDWKSLSLRSVGGDPTRTDAGGPGLAEFADTPRLRQSPYYSKILAEFPAPLRAVRLIALGPGAASPYHHDTKYGLPWGTVRLHIPVITTPGAVLTIAGETYRWASGELWYADFTRMHMVRNQDKVTRIHLVIDCQPTEELLGSFPEEFRSRAVAANSLFANSEVSLTEYQTAQSCCKFSLPRSFLSFEEPDGQFTCGLEATEAAIKSTESGIGLYLAGELQIQLIHIGEGEFRFAGWTTERTIQVLSRTNGMRRIVLRTRVGDVTRSLDIPAHPA